MNSPESAGRYASTVAQRISTPGTMPPNGMGLGLGDRRGDVFTAGNTNKSCRGPQPPNLPAMRKVRERRLVVPAPGFFKFFPRLKVERRNLARDHFHPRHAPDPDRLHVAAVHEHRKREHEPELLVHDQEPPRPDPRDVFEYVAAHLRGAAARVDARHRQAEPLRFARSGLVPGRLAGGRGRALSQFYRPLPPRADQSAVLACQPLPLARRTILPEGKAGSRTRSL